MSSSPHSTVADDASVQDVPRRIVAAWAGNDADAFAAAFTEDASLILPGTRLTGREEIRSFMAAAYAGPYKGTEVHGEPLAVRHLGDNLALVITRGGVLMPGESKVAPERAIHASWLLRRQGQEWLITAYQNTPAAAS